LVLGGKIRELRTKKGMSIAQVAELAQLSTGLISQIERDLVGPSVHSLWKISQALGVSIGYFFNEKPEIQKSPIVKKDRRRTIKLPDGNAIYELLTPDLDRKIEFIRIELKPGDANTEGLVCHEGEECGIVLQGKMLIKHGDKDHILEEGDSIYLDSTVPHRYINTGDELAVSIWAMTPPSF